SCSTPLCRGDMRAGGHIITTARVGKVAVWLLAAGPMQREHGGAAAQGAANRAAQYAHAIHPILQDSAMAPQSRIVRGLGLDQPQRQASRRCRLVTIADFDERG